MWQCNTPKNWHFCWYAFPVIFTQLILDKQICYPSHFSFSWHHSMNTQSMRNSYKRDTNTHTNVFIDSCADILYYCTQLLEMACYFCTTWHYLHTCGAHTVLGSVVQMHVYTVVQSLYTSTVNLF